MNHSSLPFALFFAPDAYSMDGKIMGRNSAGFSLLKAAAAYVGRHGLHGVGPLPQGADVFQSSLRSFGSAFPVTWHSLQHVETLTNIGALYYPAPVPVAMAHLRNHLRPSAYSCFGVTHTLSSEGAMSQLSALALPPFKPWDALICTSRAARDVFTRLRDRTREAFARETGATHFPDIQTPIIPLGVETQTFARNDNLRETTRQRFGIAAHDIVLLSAGRLTFHAKYNPAPLYQALESLRSELKVRVIVVEAGVYPNEGIAKAYQTAQKKLAPSIRIKVVDGSDAAIFAGLWQAADIFVSLSDNIQETFGLTPVEAMAAGLPVIATDWNGYRDTVRHGIDGFLVPTLSARPGSGADLALRHAVNADRYDMYIGRASLATMCDPGALQQALSHLIDDADLRRRMGEAGRQHAKAHFDWVRILSAYAELCSELGIIRKKAAQDRSEPWPDRPDPFTLFATYPTRTIGAADLIVVPEGAARRWPDIVGLAMANFGFDALCLPPAVVQSLFATAQGRPAWLFTDLLAEAGGDPVIAERAVLWLAKFGLLAIAPSSAGAAP